MWDDGSLLSVSEISGGIHRDQIAFVYINTSVRWFIIASYLTGIDNKQTSHYCTSLRNMYDVLRKHH